MTAYLAIPMLELSCEKVDFKTCLVNQTRSEGVLLVNRSGCRSYWAVLLRKRNGCAGFRGADGGFLIGRAIS